MKRCERDRGAASVLALGLIGAVVAITATIVPITSAFVASQRAANAADAAALAAADAASGVVVGVPCDLAGRSAARNGGALEACTVEGSTAKVTVTVGAAGFTLAASACAGPPR